MQARDSNGNAKDLRVGFTTSEASLSVTSASDAAFPVVGFTANPASGVLTAVGGATGYAINDLIASSATANLIVVPSMTIARVAAGSGFISKIRLVSNEASGLAGAGVKLRLWTAAPTYTNGDNGAYAVATGMAGRLGVYTGTFEQGADGAVADLTDASGGSGDPFKLASGLLVYWDLQATTAITLAAGKTFTAYPQVLQD